MTIKKICLLSMLTVILVIQEQLLTFLPNVQLTFFLIILYTKVLGLKETVIIILIYVILDNLIMSSFSLYMTPFMLLGWLLVALITRMFFNKTENPFFLALDASLTSVIYATMFILPNYFFYNIDIKSYIIADIPFTLILCLSSFVSTFLLYKIVSKKLRELYSDFNNLKNSVKN